MMLKLKLQYFGHLMRRVDSLEKTLMLGGIGGRRRRGRQRMRCLDGITDSMDLSLSELRELVTAYNLKLLGGDPLPVAAVGQDFAPYRQHMEECGIRLDGVRVFDDQFTPQCFITTDLDNNQITAFHPGAMSSAQENHVRDIPQIDFAIVAPDGREAMLQHVDEFAARGVPFIFDPGQAMPLFNGDEFRSMISKSTYVIVNDYESQLLQTRTGWSADEIARHVSAYVVTHGPRGSIIHTGSKNHHIPPARERAIVDPTGCGDAYRAGLIFGIMQGKDWPTIGRIASLMGALKVEHPGTQNQRFSYDEFAAAFQQPYRRSRRDSSIVDSKRLSTCHNFAICSRLSQTPAARPAR